MAGTVTRYQCEWCGAYVTWRNTPDGRRAFRESNRRHDYQLRPIGDDYHGRHRLEDGGIRPATFKAWDLWSALPAWNRAPLIINMDAIDNELTLDVRRYLTAQGVDADQIAVEFVPERVELVPERAADVVDPEFESWLRSVTPPPYP